MKITISSTPTRGEIIAALQQFSESYTGDVFDQYTEEQLYLKLVDVASATDFTASELIAGLYEGF